MLILSSIPTKIKWMLSLSYISCISQVSLCIAHSVINQEIKIPWFTGTDAQILTTINSETFPTFGHTKDKNMYCFETISKIYLFTTPEP